MVGCVFPYIPSSMSPMYLVPEGNRYSALPSILQRVKQFVCVWAKECV